MRLFIALDPTPTTIAALVRATATLHPHRWHGARWLPPAQWHATVRFLGATPEQQVPHWAGALDRLAALGAEATPLSIDSVALWPAPTHPRVLVVTARSTGWADAVAARAESLARDAGYRAETRPFHPHVTLARVGSRAVSADAMVALQTAAEALAGATLQFHSLSLFVSRPRQGGLAYERLATVELGPRGR